MIDMMMSFLVHTSNVSPVSHTTQIFSTIYVPSREASSASAFFQEDFILQYWLPKLMASTKTCINPCDSIQAACQQLLQHSFAILRVEPETSDSLNAAWTASRDFLSSIHKRPHDESRIIQKYRRVENNYLLGFNRPSPHKLLFRALFSQEGIPDIPSQPWPCDIDGGALKSSSTKLATNLHRLLEMFLDKLKEETRVDCSQSQGVGERPAKKRKRNENTPNVSAVGDSAPCPLDYFLYHDRNDVENCSEHVDRGVLICISLSRRVAGLEVLSRLDGCWHCPEAISMQESLYQENDTGCSDLICILSGDQLIRSIGIREEKVIQYPGLKACVHRVRRRLSMARLSISYELRSFMPRKRTTC